MKRRLMGVVISSIMLAGVVGSPVAAEGGPPRTRLNRPPTPRDCYVLAADGRAQWVPCYRLLRWWEKHR